MQNKNILAAWLIAGVAFASCEILPKDPDFTASHKVEAPLMYNKTFEFMGDSTALIDTTSEETDYDSLFSVDGDNYITISKEQDFEFGDLNDAVPVISVDPTSFESQVGEIEITDFSSSDGDLGSADIQEVTGQDPDLVPAGTNIPAGNNSANPVRLNIGQNTDFFRSATIKDGQLNLEITNTLGFDFETTEVQVIDTVANTQIGSTAEFSAANNNQLQDGETEIAVISFSPGDQLSNLGVEIVISWNSFSFPADPGALTVNSVVGDGLVASEVEAALDEQDFSTTSTATFSDEEIAFTSPNHVVELKTGELIIDQIENELEFAIHLDIIFTDIRDCPASTASSNPLVSNSDPLIISYTGANRIRRADDFGPGFSPEAEVSIAGCDLYAFGDSGNEVDYEINAFTENTKEAPEGERIRTINELQKVSSAVELTNITIKSATGIVKQQNVLLNDDQGGDEILDLFNSEEAELTEIAGLSDLSDQLDNIEFTRPRLTINYFSNIGIPTTIYGAFVGTNSDGEEIYLSGLTGSDYQIQPGDPINGLQSRGVQLGQDQAIKFTLEEIDDAVGRQGTPIVFDRTNSNVADFLNNLPNEIRFIGKAVINEDEQEATILDSLIFDPTIAIDIPLAFATEEAATFKDTVAQDLSSMPSPDQGDNSRITEGRLIINYENGLPLAINLEISFLDSTFTVFDSVPTGGDELNLLASEVDQTTRFASNPSTGSIQIVLDSDQLRELYRTRHVRISAGLLTTDENGDGSGEEVKVRTTDYITLSVKAELTIETDINLDD